MARTWAADWLAITFASQASPVGRIHPANARSIQKKRSSEARRLPMGHLASATDIASAVRFLVSDEAAYITGSCLRVDGLLLRKA